MVKSFQILKMAEYMNSPDQENYCEEEYVLTLFYLAQVYGAKGDRENSATYAFKTMQMQLNDTMEVTNEWVKNCLHLSQYYTGNMQLQQVKLVLFLWITYLGVALFESDGIFDFQEE